MREIDTCTYEHQGFRISYDGETGLWTATDPDGEFLDNIAGGLKEAMIYIEDAAAFAEADPEPESDGDYSHWNEEAEIVRRAENPEIDGRDYPPDPYDDY